MYNCIAQGQSQVCIVTQKVTFQSLASSLQREQQEPGTHQVYLYALLTPQLLWGACWGSGPWWPLFSVSSSLPLSPHIGSADWGNSTWKVAAPFFFPVASRPDNAISWMLRPHLQRHWSKKIQLEASCVCISKKGNISMQLDYPYSLCDQFLMCYTMKSGTISVLTLNSFQGLFLHWVSQKRMGCDVGEIIIYRIHNGAMSQLVSPPW